MADKKSFVFYHEWGVLLKKLPLDEAANVILALIEYSESGTIPKLSLAADIAFTAFQQAIDKDNEKWENVRLARSESGKKGGRPINDECFSENQTKAKKANGFSENQTKAKKANGFSENQTKAKKAVNVNVNDNDNVNVDNDYLSPYNPPAKEKPQKNKFAEFVSMTNDEYSSLVAKVGEQGAKRCIEILDNYKGSSGRTYKSDYRAILNWVIQRYSEEQSKPANASAYHGEANKGNAGRNEFINAVINGVDLDE